MDPVTLAVVRGALEQIADEMDLHLIRAAISPIISETHDCAHGLYDPVTGETIAQGGYGLPQFLANMQFTVQGLLPIAAAAGGFKEGDVWILNDPYKSGTHLNDVILVSPYFVDGELFALFANTGHWMDMGGSAPGGWVPTAREIHQEGIIIPPLKLYDAGRRNDGVISMITANVRMPQQLLGDLAAMTNVFATGRKGLDALVTRYGASTLKSCIDEMIRRSEAEMRSYIEEIPDGVYEITDYFDNDGVDDKPLTVKLTLTVSGSELHFDFTGTAPAARGPMNVSDTTAKSLCFVALKHIFPEVPVNGGAFRPTRFTIPKGCILAAEYPSAVGGTTDVIQRVVDVVFGALAQAIPLKTPAAPFGTTGVSTVSGTHPETGKYFIAVYPYPGGYGASQRLRRPDQRHAAGLDGEIHVGRNVRASLSRALRLSRHPRQFRRARQASRRLRHALRHRNPGPALVSILGDRVDHAPFGVEGGGPAAPNSVELITKGERWIPPMRSKAEKVAFRQGRQFPPRLARRRRLRRSADPRHRGRGSRSQRGTPGHQDGGDDLRRRGRASTQDLRSRRLPARSRSQRGGRDASSQGMPRGTGP